MTTTPRPEQTAACLETLEAGCHIQRSGRGLRSASHIDDTLDVVHGHQQFSLFNAHYAERCFLPIHVYDTALGRPVAVLLRPGKTPSGTECAPICAGSSTGSGGRVPEGTGLRHLLRSGRRAGGALQFAPYPRYGVWSAEDARR
jgi:hypothetical protein